MTDIRVRFAPSPTGFFHIGNAKTALINWLFARKYGGTLILRLEDTDVERSRTEYGDILCEALHWLGIRWDEGPAFGDEPQMGEYGPYKQSERRDLYTREVNRLLADGKAYKCFCTKEELDAERERAKAEKRPPRYSGACRNLSPDEVAAKGSMPCVIRFRVPEGETIIDDMVQGPVRTQNKEIDDFVIVKPNGDPIFHLAVVVDDGLMKVTHVIRGDDHLTNATRHVLLFNALGYDLPKFAHLPMVLDESGKKYSKRLHGANVLEWREEGYLPETLINYLVLLGWTAGDDEEIYTPEELIQAFTYERLNQSAGRFDAKKIRWINGQHIRRLSPEALRDKVLPVLHKAGFDTSAKSPEWLAAMAAICQEKIGTLNEIVPYTDYFFVAPAEYEEKGVNKHWRKEGAIEHMQAILRIFEDVGDWSHDALKAEFEKLVEETGVNLGQYIHLTRLALTGKSVGPGLFELAELLGKDTCVERTRRALETIKTLVD